MADETIGSSGGSRLADDGAGERSSRVSLYRLSAEQRPAKPRDEIEACLGLTVRQLHDLVADLRPPRMTVYWLDLTISLSLGYGALLAVPQTWPPSALATGLGLVAVLALYRAAVFIHEIAHFSRSLSPAFVVAWNLLCGIPGLLPSFLYETHRDHHAARFYGSRNDGEYLPPGQSPGRSTFVILTSAPLRFPALFIRFLVIAPLGWLLPSLRGHVLARMSALVMHGDYVRRDVTPGRTPAHWLWQEAGSFLSCMVFLALIVVGVIPGSRVLEIWLIASTASLLESLRVLVAHEYRNDGGRMTFSQQVLDSKTFGGWLAELWAPLGLRFHAEHHLLPYLPYHALPEAHRRLMRVIPESSPFRSTTDSSLVVALFRFVTREPRRVAGE